MNQRATLAQPLHYKNSPVDREKLSLSKTAG